MKQAYDPAEPSRRKPRSVSQCGGRRPRHARPAVAPPLDTAREPRQRTAAGHRAAPCRHMSLGRCSSSATG